MEDVYAALAGMAFERACLLLFALLLQLPVSQHRSFRYATAFLISAAILLVQPLIYYSPTQRFSMTLAGFGCMTSWCILHWTFLEPLSKNPTISEVFFSTYLHPLEGVIKVHQRRLKQQAGPTKPTSKSPPPPQPNAHCSTVLWTLLLEATATLLLVQVTCDVGLYLLCSLSNGMCSMHTSIPTWLGLQTSVAQSDSSEPVSYLVRCAFAFPAGILLTQQVDISWCTLRMGVILAAFRWPSLAHLAAQLPTRAFNWPIMASSVGELWGMRWHQTLRFYFEGLGGGVVNAFLPKGKSPPALRAALRCVVAFALSGLLHEYITWAGFGILSGWHMAFFMLNGAAVLVETLAPVLVAACFKPKERGSQLKGQSCTVTAHVTARVGTRDGHSKSGSKDSSGVATVGGSANIIVPVWLKHAWTLGFFILSGPLFVEPIRAAGFFSERAFYPFGSLITPQVLEWASNKTAMLMA